MIRHNKKLLIEASATVVAQGEGNLKEKGAVKWVPCCENRPSGEPPVMGLEWPGVHRTAPAPGSWAEQTGSGEDLATGLTGSRNCPRTATKMFF